MFSPFGIKEKDENDPFILLRLAPLTLRVSCFVFWQIYKSLKGDSFSANFVILPFCHHSCSFYRMIISYIMIHFPYRLFRFVLQLIHWYQKRVSFMHFFLSMFFRLFLSWIFGHCLVEILFWFCDFCRPTTKTVLYSRFFSSSLLFLCNLRFDLDATIQFVLCSIFFLLFLCCLGIHFIGSSP
jgi:hypothetical protein